MYRELLHGAKTYGDDSSGSKFRMYYEYYFFKSFVMFWSFYIYFSNFWKKEKELQDDEEDGIFEAI